MAYDVRSVLPYPEQIALHIFFDKEAFVRIGIGLGTLILIIILILILT